MKNSVKLKNQRGFTLIEVAIVLTIVGLVIGGIWIAASTVSSNQKKSALAQDTLSIIQATRNVYAQSVPPATTATTVIVPALINAGAIPSNLITGTTLRNVFGGTTAVATDGNSNFVITYTLIPEEACIELLSGRIASSISAANKIGLVGASASATPGTKQDYTPITADTACVAGTNTMSFAFKSQ